jgi:hypothetical protein
VIKLKQKMNKKIATEIAIGIILIATVIIGGLIWPGNKLQAPTPVTTQIKNPTEKSIASPNQEIPASQNQKAGWRIYKNEGYEYEILYPENWYVYADSSSNVFFQPEKEEVGSVPGPHADALGIKVSFVSDDNMLNVIEGQLGTSDFDKSSTIIGGIQGLKVKTKCEGVGCGSPLWFVLEDKWLYQFDSNLGYQDNFDKIIATFKFSPPINNKQGFTETKRDSRYVHYSGLVALSGYYSEFPLDGIFGGTLCFNADKKSSYLIPRDKDDTRKPWFCFEKQDEAKAKLGLGEGFDLAKCPSGISGDATIVVNGYVVDKLESEVFDTAKLENAVSSSQPSCDL